MTAIMDTFDADTEAFSRGIVQARREVQKFAAECGTPKLRVKVPVYDRPALNRHERRKRQALARKGAA